MRKKISELPFRRLLAFGLNKEIHGHPDT